MEKTKLEADLYKLENVTKVNLQNSIDNIADDQEEAIREELRNDLKSQYEDEC